MGLHQRNGRATTPVSAVLMFLLFCHMRVPTAIAIPEQNQTNTQTDYHQGNSMRNNDSPDSTSSENKTSPFCPDGTFSRDRITCSTCAMGCPESMYISTPCSQEMDTQCAFCPASNVTDWNEYPGCSAGDNASTGLLNRESEMLTTCENDCNILAYYFIVPFVVLIVLLFGCFLMGCTSLTNTAQHRTPSAAEAISGACEVSNERTDYHTVIPAVSDRQLSCTSDRDLQTVCESNVSFVKPYHTQPPSAASSSETYKGESASVTLNDRTQDIFGNICQKMSPLSTPKSRSSGQGSWTIRQPSSRPHIILNDISSLSSNNEDRTTSKSKTSGCIMNERVIGNEFDVNLSRHCGQAEDLSPQQRVLPILHKFDTGDVCIYYLSDSSGASSTRSSIMGDPRLNMNKGVHQKFIYCIDDFTEKTVIQY